MMVLLGGVGTVVAFIWSAGLRPWHNRSRPALADLGVTDDRFALAIGETGVAFDHARVRALLSRFRPASIEDRAEEEVA